MAKDARQRSAQPQRMSSLTALVVAVLAIVLVWLVLSLLHGSWFPGTW